MQPVVSLTESELKCLEDAYQAIEEAEGQFRGRLVSTSERTALAFRIRTLISKMNGFGTLRQDVSSLVTKMNFTAQKLMELSPAPPKPQRSLRDTIEREVLEEGMAAARVMSAPFRLIGAVFEQTMKDMKEGEERMSPRVRLPPKDARDSLHSMLAKAIEKITPQSVKEAPERLKRQFGIPEEETQKFLGDLVEIGLGAALMSLLVKVKVAPKIEPTLPEVPTRIGNASIIPYTRPKEGIHRYTMFLDKPGGEALMDIAVMKSEGLPLMKVYVENLTAIRHPSTSVVTDAFTALQEFGRSMRVETIIAQGEVFYSRLDKLINRKALHVSEKPLFSDFMDIAKQDRFAQFFNKKTQPRIGKLPSIPLRVTASRPDLGKLRLARRIEEGDAFIFVSPFIPAEAIAANTAFVIKYSLDSPVKTVEISTCLSKLPREINVKHMEEVIHTETAYSIPSGPFSRTVVSLKHESESVARFFFEPRGDTEVYISNLEGFIAARKYGAIDIQGMLEHLTALVEKASSFTLRLFSDQPGTTKVIASLEQAGYTKKHYFGDMYDFKIKDLLVNE